MRLFLLTALTMLAFAANSIFNRLAVDSGAADPGAFAVLRVLSGAVVLAMLVWVRSGKLHLARPARLVGAGSLTLYMVGFSMAYQTLDAGVGALILFGVVQVAMFGFSTIRGSVPTFRQVCGAVIAFAGLAWVLWPAGAAQVEPIGALLMASAGLGWAAYTLAGRKEPDALAGTAANFLVALPATLAAVIAFGQELQMTVPGAVLACLSGAGTSGLGYALWYRVVPQLSPAVAATVQLSVPVLALAAGLLFLQEEAGLRLLAGALLVLGGIALVVSRRSAA